MTVASYTTDLVLITDAQSGTWGEITGHTGGMAPVVNDTDYYIQGTGCVTQSTAGKTGLQVSMYFDYASDLSASITAGKCVFFWQVILAGNAMETFDNGGLRVGIGSDVGNFKFWKSGGKDYGRNPYGGWQNIAIDPRWNSSVPDYTINSPTGVWRYFGSIPNLLSSISKGNLHALDAIRYGRGKIEITNGDVTNGYANFDDMAATNDAVSYSWGLFQEIAGGYLWKGFLSFGTTVSGVDFRDSNRNIIIDDAPRTYTSFNRIEIINSSSRVDWTGINFQVLGTTAKGEFQVIDNADVNIDTCTFVDMSTFIFRSNSTINDSIFRRCDLVTQSGSVFDNDVFSEATDSVRAFLMDNPENVTNCTFISSGSKHAIEVTVSGSYDFVGNKFEDYATQSGVAENRAIFNNSGGLLILNIFSGDTPSYKDGTDATTTINNPKVLAITGLVTNSEVRIYLSADSSELDGIENSGTTFDYYYNYTADFDVDVVIFNTSYIAVRYTNITLDSDGYDLLVQQQIDRQYSNPV